MHLAVQRPTAVWIGHIWSAISLQVRYQIRTPYFSARRCYRNSVRLSVCHAGDPHLSGSAYRNISYTTARQSYVHSFKGQTLQLRVQGSPRMKEFNRGTTVRLPKTIILPIHRDHSETVRDRM